MPPTRPNREPPPSFAASINAADLATLLTKCKANLDKVREATEVAAAAQASGPLSKEGARSSPDEGSSPAQEITNEEASNEEASNEEDSNEEASNKEAPVRARTATFSLWPSGPPRQHPNTAPRPWHWPQPQPHPHPHPHPRQLAMDGGGHGEAGPGSSGGGGDPPPCNKKQRLDSESDSEVPSLESGVAQILSMSPTLGASKVIDELRRRFPKLVLDRMTTKVSRVLWRMGRVARVEPFRTCTCLSHASRGPYRPPDPHPASLAGKRPSSRAQGDRAS